jgi:hypothetical protein
LHYINPQPTGNTCVLFLDEVKNVTTSQLQEENIR